MGEDNDRCLCCRCHLRSVAVSCLLLCDSRVNGMRNPTGGERFLVGVELQVRGIMNMSSVTWLRGGRWMTGWGEFGRGLGGWGMGKNG